MELASNRQGLFLSRLVNTVAINALTPPDGAGRFLISIDKLQRVKTVVIWNALGQKIREIEALNKELLEIYLFTPGNYIIGFISNNQVISTQQVVITGW
jgi:hypothetical protein